MVSERGGRVFGPFLSSSHESIFWLNPALASLESFREFLKKDEWNTGGDRFWIGPEVQYLYQDRRRQVETTVIQAAMDPGDFHLETAGDGQWSLSNNLTLRSYNVGSGEKRLHFETLLRPVEDPLRTLSAYPDLTRDCPRLHQ